MEPVAMLPKRNTLYYGDNFHWMSQWDDGCFDLVYLDPPFNSDEDYNMIFGSGAQVRAFDDIWQWGEEAAKDFDIALGTTPSIQMTISGFQRMIPETPMMAYLSHLAPRLYHMHRLLKQTGSLYLHCDDTACHYIKILLDAVFGPANYKNTIVWRRATAHSDARRFGRIADHIFFYTKSDAYTWNGRRVREPLSPDELLSKYSKEDERGKYYSGDLTGHGRPKSGDARSAVPWRDYDVAARGRHWAVPKIGNGDYADYIKAKFIPDYEKFQDPIERLEALDEANLIQHPTTARGKWPGIKRYAEAEQGRVPQNIILNPTGFTNYNKTSEFLGYDTQKPEALLRKLIKCSSNPGDMVLDPYCGCGTTVHVCRDLEGTGLIEDDSTRDFVGIDITHVAIGVIEYRFAFRLNEMPNVVGAPEDFEAAQDLFNRSPKQFEAWAVSRFRGFMPNEVKTGDRGIDGRASVFTQKAATGRPLALMQVKGGNNLNPAMAREFRGTMDTEGAQIGVFLVMAKRNITRGIKSALASETIEFDGTTYPKTQAFSIEEYFEGKYPNLPPMLPAHTSAAPSLFDHAAQRETAEAT
jgi:DNA modification methylase